MGTEHKPTATVPPQLLELHSIVREIGRKEDRRGEERKRGGECVPPYLLPLLQITLRHVNATLLLGLWVTPGSSADQNSKTRKEKSQLLQSGESLKKKTHKTTHKIFYAQVFTYLYLQKKDYRGNIHCITSSTMDMQHLGLLVALELFGNSSVVPIVTRAWKAEVLTSHLNLRISL